MSARTLAGIALLLCLLAGLWLVGTGRQFRAEEVDSGCWPDTPALVLAGQSVPSAAYVPCVAGGPGLWVPTELAANSSEGSRYRLALRRDTVWTLTLQSDCPEVPPGAPGEQAAAGPQASESRSTLPPDVQLAPAGQPDESGALADVYRFPGGCVTSTLLVAEGADASGLLSATRASLRLVPPPERP